MTLETWRTRSFLGALFLSLYLSSGAQFWKILCRIIIVIILWNSNLNCCFQLPWSRVSIEKLAVTFRALGMIGICLGLEHVGVWENVLLIYISAMLLLFQTWNIKLAYVLFSIAVELLRQLFLLLYISEGYFLFFFNWKFLFVFAFSI